jgi:hypothetical protein
MLILSLLYFVGRPRSGGVGFGDFHVRNRQNTRNLFFLPPDLRSLGVVGSCLCGELFSADSAPLWFNQRSGHLYRPPHSSRHPAGFPQDTACIRANPHGQSRGARFRLPLSPGNRKSQSSSVYSVSQWFNQEFRLSPATLTEERRPLGSPHAPC